MNARDFNNLRAVVTHAQPAGLGASRPCPNCDMPCVLSLGRTSRKYFWRHIHVSDCALTSIGSPVFFDTKEQALLDPQMFHKE